jgi:hypothetical protein
MKMDEYKRKKSNNSKGKRTFYRKRRAHGGMLGGASYRPRPPPIMSRRDYRYNNEQKHIAKEEKSHWNGKVEVWTEPQKPRQEKIVRYEVDTDKLLRELAKGNKDALNEITERLEREIEQEPSEEAENQKKADVAKRSTDEFSSEVSEETEQKSEPNTEGSDQAETDLQDEELKGEKSEDKTEAHEDAETEPQAENVNESQEIPQDTETKPENSTQEDALEDTDLVYMNPSFWEQLESEMSDELELLEPEEDFEIPPEENEPAEEG